MADNESIVIKPREFSDDLLLPQNTDELAKFMDEPLQAIAEAITGAMAAGPKSWMLMGGRIVQSMFKGKLYQQVSREVKDLRDSGKISSDFADEEKNKYGAKSWVELLTFIDEHSPDADRLDAVKAMFYGINKVNASDAERIVNYQLLQIAKALTSGELLLLKAIVESHRNSDFAPGGHSSCALNHWAAKTSNRIGHGLTYLVYKDEVALMRHELISKRLNSPDLPYHQQQVMTENARLTDLGLRFIQAIESYHREIG
jgi:hypothetical protein